MSRFCPLFSSSKGNSAYLSGGGTHLLIDMGVSLRQLTRALGDHDLAPDMLHGVLITHEHTDHIKGLPMLLKKYRLPVYGSRGTLKHLAARADLPAGALLIELSQTTEIGGIEVTPFATPHDASHSTGFRFRMPDDRTVAVATDLGHITDEVRTHISGCDLVMLESNYDPDMLACSSYPYPLKRRIRGDFGHLSNEDSARECVHLIQGGTTRLFLAHLSEQNNLPEIARRTAKALLDNACMRENLDYILGVAPARGYSEVTVF